MFTGTVGENWMRYTSSQQETCSGYWQRPVHLVLRVPVRVASPITVQGTLQLASFVVKICLLILISFRGCLYPQQRRCRDQRNSLLERGLLVSTTRCHKQCGRHNDVSGDGSDVTKVDGDDSVDSSADRAVSTSMAGDV